MYYQPTFTPDNFSFGELSSEQRADVLSGLMQMISGERLVGWPVLPPPGLPKYTHLACLIERVDEKPSLIVCPNWDDVIQLQATKLFARAKSKKWYAMRDWWSMK